MSDVWKNLQDSMIEGLKRLGRPIEYRAQIGDVPCVPLGNGREFCYDPQADAYDLWVAVVDPIGDVVINGLSPVDRTLHRTNMTLTEARAMCEAQR